MLLLLIGTGCDTAAPPTADGAIAGCDGSACRTPPVADDDDGGVDPESDAGHEPSQPDAAPDAAADASAENDPCDPDAGCDDGNYCNGAELCLPVAPGASGFSCRRPPLGPCADRACDESQDTCDCTDPDRDDDGFEIEGCAGDAPADCDDQSDNIYPGAGELCDAEDRDEDCDPSTFAGPVGFDRNRDKDGDDFVSGECCNVDGYGRRHCGPDCDDMHSVIHPDNTEACDDYDNDCDGWVDEALGAREHGGLRHEFFPDIDGDGWGKGEAITACTAPEGYVFSDEDCDDTDREVSPVGIEVCNGKDDDCDGLEDAADDLLIGLPTFSETEVQCIDGGPKIVECPQSTGYLDCNEYVLDGCETDATTLSHCHECNRSCNFSCSASDCDEITSLSAGAFHTCAVTERGVATCWGANDFGQLGDDSKTSRHEPTKVAMIADVRQIAAGYGHTCAIVGGADELFCWGDNASGQLGARGVGTDDTSEVPLQVIDGFDGISALDGVRSVAAGQAHTCATYDDGWVACWGSRADGRLGDGSAETEPPLEYVPWPVLGSDGDFVQDAQTVVAGRAHTCIVNAARGVLCWGDNSAGQLGNGKDAPDSVVAQTVEGLDMIDEIVAGPYHTCALSQGRVLCWGANSFGQLGSAADDDGRPTEVTGLSDVVAIAAGADFSCAVTASRTMYCWGSNNFGERGDPDPAAGRMTTIAIDPVVSVSAGAGHVCALAADDQVWCWGNNSRGQSGDPQLSISIRPSPHRLSWLTGSKP